VPVGSDRCVPGLNTPSRALTLQVGEYLPGAGRREQNRFRRPWAAGRCRVGLCLCWAGLCWCRVGLCWGWVGLCWCRAGVQRGRSIVFCCVALPCHAEPQEHTEQEHPGADNPQPHRSVCHQAQAGPADAQQQSPDTEVSGCRAAWSDVALRLDVNGRLIMKGDGGGGHDHSRSVGGWSALEHSRKYVLWTRDGITIVPRQLGDVLPVPPCSLSSVSPLVPVRPVSAGRCLGGCRQRPQTIVVGTLLESLLRAHPLAPLSRTRSYAAKSL
jgi:hypothetical protein